MKRIASAAAAVALGMLPVVAGSSGSASASPAPAPKADVSAQECGLSRVQQSYTNCLPHPHLVSIAYYDSTSKSSGNVVACAQPGTTATINLIGPFRLALTAAEGNHVPC